MKKNLFVLFSIICFLILTSCQSIYRNYNDADLNEIAVNDFGFSEVLFFKIIDSETAEELTGHAYVTSGVIYGIKNDHFVTLFVPREVAEEPFVIDAPIFNITLIYNKLKSLEDSSGNKLFTDTSGDYGGLSITVTVSDSIKSENPSLVFDTPVTYVITTDATTFYVGIAQGQYYIFNSGFVIISQFND